MDNIGRFIDFDFKYKWRSIIFDVFILQFLGFVLLGVGELLRIWKFLEFIVKSPEAIRVADFFLLLILLFGLYKLVLEKIENRKLLKDSKYEFTHNDWPNKWIFNGKTETLSRIDELFVKSSRAGCLLKTHLWRNFRMTFEMKFDAGLRQYIGIVFRAYDLDNYFMLEVFRDYYGSSNGKHSWRSGVKPHVRYRGGWEIMSPERHDQFDFSNFESVVLEVKEEILTLFYKHQPIFKWTLPTHVDVNHIEAGFKQDKHDDKKEQVDIIGKNMAGVVKAIPFRLSYGMIGFRAHPGQGAIIRSLKVEPI